MVLVAEHEVERIEDVPQEHRHHVRREGDKLICGEHWERRGPHVEGCMDPSAKQMRIDLRAEHDVLFEEAQEHGDDLERAATRLGAGKSLARELFGNAPEPEASAHDVDEIRAEAQVQADRLWKRMESTA